MKNLLLPIKLALFLLINFNSNITYSDSTSPTLNGIEYPKGLKKWNILSTSYRTDNNTQRIILGNSIAINASKSGQTNPWPEGSILAKLVWKKT